MRLMQLETKNSANLRYSISDHLNSVGGEADEHGCVTSQEEYYPYGGSAGADEEAEEISDRTRRYSGKERDACGLLYYGWRYYQPDAARWLSADPGGLIDGPNLYRFTRNSPLNLIDNDGQSPTFSELFKAERGDLFYGLGHIIDGYQTRWGQFSNRMDYMGLVISPNQTRQFANEISRNRNVLLNGHINDKSIVIERIKELAYKSIRDGEYQPHLGVFNHFPKSWKNGPLLNSLIHHLDKGEHNYSLENTVNESIQDSQSRYSSLVNENNGGNLSLEQLANMDEDWKVDTAKKFITRISKASLDMILKSGLDDKIHFILDGVNIEKTIKKEEVSNNYYQSCTTAAELRFLYRNRNAEGASGKVVFYKNRVQVQAPWETEPGKWQAYRPKSHARR